MSQMWTEKDKRFDSIEEEPEFLGSSESENQVLVSYMCSSNSVAGLSKMSSLSRSNVRAS